MAWDSALGTASTFVLLYQPQMIDDDDDDDCGAIGVIRISRGDRSIRRKPATVSLCPPQIPHDLTRVRTRVAAVGSRILTACVMARPIPTLYLFKLRLEAFRSKIFYILLMSPAGSTCIIHAIKIDLPTVILFGKGKIWRSCNCFHLPGSHTSSGPRSRQSFTSMQKKT
jgi:hypothetical protein